MAEDLTNLYQKVVINHTKNPQNFRILENATKGFGENAMCGDSFDVFIKMQGNIISEISFQGHGCAISMSCASLMTEAVKGKNLEKIQEIFEKLTSMLDGELDDFSSLGDLQAFAEIAKFPIRKKCAILAWNALFNAIKNHQ